MKKKKQLMRTDVSERISSYSNLYDADWAREAAEDGYRTFLNIIKQALSSDKFELIKNNYHLQLMYFTGFEQAYNTILKHFLDDTKTELELTLFELSKLTASIKKK